MITRKFDTRRTALGVASVLACSLATQALADASTAQAAVWTPRELTFQYQGFQTKYSCDGLRQKMKKLLLMFGARPDLEVSEFGCTRLNGPDPFAGVRIRMSVLQPASAGSSAPVPAHWTVVNALANREPFDAAADCELIGQVAQKVLPAFAARDVDFKATCALNQPVIGNVHLSAAVLTADPAATR